MTPAFTRAVGFSLLLGLYAVNLPTHAAQTAPSGLVQDTIDVKGQKRSFLLYVPRTLKPNAPLLFVLHPSGGDGPSMRGYTNGYYDKLADAQGFAVVYPDGYQDTWNDCRKGSPFPSNTLNIDDVSFIDALIARMATNYAIDRKRVFAMGWSNGAQLAYRLGLERPDEFAGIAAISASVPVDDNLDCMKSGKPIPAMVINGTADPVNPYRGGMVTLGFSQLGNVVSSEQTAQYWAKLLGIDAAPTTTRLPHEGSKDAVTQMTWIKDGKPAVVHYMIQGGGHEIPYDSDLDALKTIWDFFAQLPSR